MRREGQRGARRKPERAEARHLHAKYPAGAAAVREADAPLERHCRRSAEGREQITGQLTYPVLREFAELHARGGDRVADELDPSSFERGFDALKSAAARRRDAVYSFKTLHCPQGYVRSHC